MAKTPVKFSIFNFQFSRKEIIILFLIIFVGAFLRLYRIGEYMTFLGDEGRDALIVRRFLVEGDLMLIGPGTSIGNMYLGPLYYYLIAPSLFLANYSPVGPSVFVALVGVATVVLVWWVGKEWFGKWAGIFAAFLYSLSPTVIIYSKSSWNPNIMPFFALLVIYGMWMVWDRDDWKWLVVVGVSMAFVLQSHYLGLLLAPLIVVYWLAKLAKIQNSKLKIKNFLSYSLVGGLVFVFLMSPLVIFDARHGWRNFDAIKTFFIERQTTVSARPWNAIPNAWPLMELVSTRLVAGRNEVLGRVVAVGLIGSVLFVIKKRLSSGYVMLFVWLGFAVLGLGLYKQHIYDHYFGFFFPAPFLLIGGVLGDLIGRVRIRGWWIAGTVILALAYFSLADSPVNYPPNRQLQNTQATAEFIREKAGGEPFNLAVIAERNYEDAYQYFLEKWDTGIVEIDPLRADETITDQLFVVCEMPKEKCDPTHSPKAEVANFGWTKIEEEWPVGGYAVYKLVHFE